MEVMDCHDLNGSIDKHIRYDRGIRIWGQHGQAALDKAKVCLLNCSATGAEALKNMVLGGINLFTIVDDNIVTQKDLDSNFMMFPSSLGALRAQVVTEVLKEMNEFVDGSFVDDSPRSIIKNNPSFFLKYDVVIASQLAEDDAVALDGICRGMNIPVVYARAYGLVGMLRNSIEEHCVIESKPENTVQDYRFADPWPELKVLADSVRLEDLDQAEHSHVPYGIILIKAAAEWRTRHQSDKALPCTSSDRQEFKNIIKSWQLRMDDCPIPEENFEEALANVSKVWGAVDIPKDITSILEDEKAYHLTKDVEPFWIVCAALRMYVSEEGRGHLPLCGKIPDMHSSTARYLEMEQVYREKSERDVALIYNRCQMICKNIGIDPLHVSLDFVRTMCLNARTLRVVRPKSVQSLQESQTPALLKNSISCEGKGSLTLILLLLRCVDTFYEQHGRYPGNNVTESDHVDTEEDAALLKHILISSTGNHLHNTDINDDMLLELVRCGGEELHCVAAIVGAMASQEVIKFLTGQCVPLEGTLIYDGINCITGTFDVN
jgi:amyloid beta precursor protein binding protein 1